MALAAELGTEAACQIARMELANIRALHAFATEHHLDCDSNPCQTADVVYDRAAWDAAHAAVDASMHLRRFLGFCLGRFWRTRTSVSVLPCQPLSVMDEH